VQLSVSDISHGGAGNVHQLLDGQRQGAELSGMSASPWSDWQPLALTPPPRDSRVLAELLDGGQAFRWNRSIAAPAATRVSRNT